MASEQLSIPSNMTKRNSIRSRGKRMNRGKRGLHRDNISSSLRDSSRYKDSILRGSIMSHSKIEHRITMIDKEDD